MAQLLREAFSFDPVPKHPVPKHLLRDRDGIFGAEFGQQVRDLGMKDLSLPRVEGGMEFCAMATNGPPCP
jgi:hypothetical protein